MSYAKIKNAFSISKLILIYIYNKSNISKKANKHITSSYILDDLAKHRLIDFVKSFTEA